MYFVEGSIVQHLALDIKIILSKNVPCKDFTILFWTALISYMIYQGRGTESQTKLKRFPMIMGANVANVASME